MSKNRSGKRQAQVADQPELPTTSADAAGVSRTWRLLTLAVILIATVITYLPVFDGAKEFTNWDDPAYVTEQPLVRSLDAANIKQMFKTESRVAANYHPLTMLTLAYDYQRGEGQMWAFMQTTLLLHLINTALVFLFVGLLFRKSLLMPVLCAAFFGLHPMHVESVAWVAERKDVLYTAFYLVSLIGYVRYLRGGSWAWLVAAFASFIASCYAKPMAVTLPVVLLLLDVFEKRAFSVRSALEKVPFLVVSVIFGLLTLEVQSSIPGLVDVTSFSLPQRMLFAGYGITEYIVRLFVPLKLSAFYPYPSTGAEPWAIAYVYSGMAVLLVCAVMVISRKRQSELTSTLFFGMGFFVVTISIVLQLISVGGAVIADRYTYVPYIGLFVMIGGAMDRTLPNVRRDQIGLSIVLVASIWFAVLSNARIDVWKNSGVLFDDVIKLYPSQPVRAAYNNRALYNLEKGKLLESERDYQYLEVLGVSRAYTYKGYGALLMRMKRPAEAIPRFTTALELGGDDVQVIRARGRCYSQLQRHDSAIADLSRARELDPNDIEVATLLIEECLSAGRFQEAITYGSTMQKLAGMSSQYHVLMGVANGQLGNHAAAYKAFARALELDPKNEQAKMNMEIARRNY